MGLYINLREAFLSRRTDKDCLLRELCKEHGRYLTLVIKSKEHNENYWLGEFLLISDELFLRLMSK